MSYQHDPYYPPPGHPPPGSYQGYRDEDEDDSPHYSPQHRPYEEEDDSCGCCGCHCSGFFKGCLAALCCCCVLEQCCGFCF